ncbi:uncharacterized protein LOC115246263 [Formica exsecta]|uniref:uncharacterized protein LOC115246263 n=1 Tax=Formica exsecta TaxID=72781 RepID=UPI0011427052|nr:uncharacterized protein LOC115246263 [Formica exsecta]
MIEMFKKKHKSEQETPATIQGNETNKPDNTACNYAQLIKIPNAKQVLLSTAVVKVVIKESSATTKTRVVFDASSKDSKRKSTILWREDLSDEVEAFELVTVTYGTKQASFLAVRCLQQLAEMEEANFPVAAEVIRRDFYMDDLLTGANTVRELTQLKKKITELLLKGGFELHKWITNVLNISDNIQMPNISIDIDKEPQSKLLGILWNPYKDTFHYETTMSWDDGRVTKRAMLSQNVQWDESVPMDIHKAWLIIKSQLKLLNTMEIPRLILSDSPDLQIQAHGFCDASEKTYGACIFLRGKDHKNITVSLICSKSRVAPLKALSLPWLELCGATLLINLMNRVLTSLNVQQHVSSKKNPADLISRGTTPEHLKHSSLWWEGPHWLKMNENTWPIEGEELQIENVPEKREHTHLESYNTKCDAKKRKIGPVSASEIDDAMKVIVKIAQSEEFKDEIKSIKSDGRVLRKSSLIALNPFLDQQEILKCRKAHPTPSHQIMGQLPPARVNVARPFWNAGVDYCGPFYVRDRVRRNSKQYKSYVAIFVCMATKAVHIEVVEDLSTESFIAALKRFISRRGRVKNLYSDNGRNFVGADRELQALLHNEEFKESVLESTAVKRVILVRSMKLHLKRTVGNACLTVAEMTTVLTQVEAILNSRPLTPILDDPADLRALTPGHFLIGENLMAYSESNLQDIPLNKLSRWQHMEQIKQHFWARWQKGYLSSCQQRSKWKSDTNTKLQVGQSVMLKDNATIPLKWNLARIVEVHPGSDGVVRTVTVRNNMGVYKDLLSMFVR